MTACRATKDRISGMQVAGERMGAAVLLTVLIFSVTACDVMPADRISTRDVHAEALASVTGPMLFPTVKPPQLDHVTVGSVNGLYQLRVQHHDINVVVCSTPPCLENARTLRTVETGAEPVVFAIDYAGLGQNPTPTPELNAELTEFWSTAEFVDERPSWLTMDLYPGVFVNQS